MSSYYYLGEAWSVHFSPDGQRFAVSTHQGMIKLYDTGIYGSNTAEQATYTSEGKSTDGKVKLWDIGSRQCLSTVGEHKDQSEDHKYTVYHKLFNQPTYSKRGVLVLTPTRKVAKYISSIDTIPIQDFTGGTSSDSLYLIKIVNEQNPTKVLKSFTKMCLLEASNFEDEIVVHLDKYNNVQDEQRYLLLVENLLKSGSYYFSYTYDLTNTLQRQSRLKDSTFPHLWQRADDRFFWNRHLQSKLIDFTLNNPEQDVRTRYFSRGIDAEGNVSNFNETEQIILLDPIKNSHAGISFEGKIKLSYVQTRGSIPIHWAQVNDIKYTPKLQIMTLPNTSDATRKHFDEQTKIYGKQILVNLVNKKGSEYRVAEGYDKAVTRLNDSRISYYHFDFHHECREMKWDRIQILIDLIEEDLIQQGYYYSEELNGLNILRLQTSVVRTNCMDCLDRTNVVQSTLAKWMLTQQLREVGVLSNKERIEEIIWADNADAISFPYSGTGAQKTDFT
ncbi:9177_t:CDS:10, partial [Acaulospora colombiana]